MRDRDHLEYRDDDLFNPETAHEHSDVPLRPLWWALVIFIVFAFVTHIVITLFYKGLAKAERDRMDPPQTQVTRPANADVPQNQPLLQPFPRTNAKGEAVPPQAQTPVVDLVEMRAGEDRVLLNYGWVDQQKGVVRLPIQVAKERLAAQLAVQGQVGTTTPVATTTAPATATPAPAPSEQTAPAEPATAPATNTGAHQ